MLKRNPIKKEYLLIIASMIMVVISYQFAFKKTIEALQENKSLKLQLERAGDLSVQPSYLQRKSRNLSKIINLYKTDTSDLRNNIINTIASIAEKENVKLSDVPVQDPLFHTSNFIIQKVSFEGEYFALMNMLEHLQYKEGIGFVRSITCKYVKNRQPSNVIQPIILDCYLLIAK